MSHTIRGAALVALGTIAMALTCLASPPADVTIVGDWEVKVSVRDPRPVEATVHVEPPRMVTVKAEKFDSLPIFNPKAGGWVKGAQLRGVKTQETTSANLLDPASFSLRAGPEPDAPRFTQGADYEIDLNWGTFGRLAESAIKPDQPVFATYRHAQMRLDAVAL